MNNFKTFFNLNEKRKSVKNKKRKKDEDNETQINDPYSDSDLSTKPAPFNRKKTFVVPPNYGMGEGQRLVPKPATFTEMMDMTVGHHRGPGKKIVIIYPGEFQPFYKKHARIYNHLKDEYPQAEVFISTSNSTNPSDAPFNFEDKLKLILSSGVDPKMALETHQPFKAPEIINKYSKKDTILIFVVSEEKMIEYLNSDYYQKFKSLSKCQPLSDHAYIKLLPKSKGLSGSQIRNLYRNSDDSKRKEIITRLYGTYKPDIHKTFNEKLI